MESEDTGAWSFPEEVLCELPEEYWRRQTHDMGVMQYANQYLGLVSMQEHPFQGKLRREGELTWSHDGIVWKRICPGQLVVPTGAEGSYDSRCTIPVYMPVIHQDEVRVYYIGSGDAEGGLCLARLKPDRLAGMSPVSAEKPATVTIRNLQCTGKHLYVNAKADGGTVRVGLVSHSRYDDEGERALDECRPIASDVVDARVAWQDGKDLSRFVNYPLRLTFKLDNATLYSFRFGT